VLVEHARNVLEVRNAVHSETSADGDQVITPLACSLDGQTIDVELRPGTKLFELHGRQRVITELTTCSYGLAPDRADIASAGGMIASGVDHDGEVRAIERHDHPFFVATLYQPQLQSTPSSPHPAWLGFLEACR